MELDLTSSELKELWEKTRRTSFAHKIREIIPNDLLVKYYKSSSGVVSFNPENNFIEVNEIRIPLKTLRDLNATVKSWGPVVKTVQALELENIEAHRFFKFPDFEIDDGYIILDRDRFLLRKKADGLEMPLFTTSEITELARLING